jgi:hypothetical protein
MQSGLGMQAPGQHLVATDVIAASRVAATIGIIANPVSARDIRRVVANAGNLQITDRVNIVLRVLSSAAACGVQRALVMPDRGGIRALLERQLRRQHHHHHHEPQGSQRAGGGGSGHSEFPQVEFLDFEPESTVDDTFAATRLLLRAGVGGHRRARRRRHPPRGRARAGRRGSRMPLAGLSTGTNNAFPEMREPTITGMAVGLYAGGGRRGRGAGAQQADRGPDRHRVPGDGTVPRHRDRRRGGHARPQRRRARAVEDAVAGRGLPGLCRARRPSACRPSAVCCNRSAGASAAAWRCSWRPRRAARRR